MPPPDGNNAIVRPIARGIEQAPRGGCSYLDLADFSRARDSQTLLPCGRAFDIPRRDHMLAVGDKAFKAAVLRFLAEQP
jgi:hypothetical protein